jgi:hypothetical protein
VVRLTGLVIAAIVLLATATTSPTSAGGVSITPAAGAQGDVFTIAGEGLQAGLALDINFISPEQNVFSTAIIGKVVIVDPQGNFLFEVVPARDFAGSSFGTWTVQVCVTQTDDCVQTTFEITS